MGKTSLCLQLLSALSRDVSPRLTRLSSTSTPARVTIKTISKQIEAPQKDLRSRHKSICKGESDSAWPIFVRTYYFEERGQKLFCNQAVVYVRT